ncbi:unnamed protein product [Rotaria socialis]|uniref:Ig-like domain-containing protein n=2 Tax=Rotaria socialis TaxID=392032 RepID=A0A820RKS1_9BILA|nr:unnamed protein product [Rotaria socialis]CAF3369561.1 unnamed protein product [Rotaria socialis]CAF3391804.1 unnamed protein product [Rotaria socialis]CAF3521010.1 unnamed protein product [Rotaria socialis]CAF3527857.1 unnamed protein product [Rotaria socialis]
MTATYRLQLPLLIITYVIFSSTIEVVNAIEYASPKINQKILIGPSDITTYPGETIQFPCIVSKQPDAIVTWCWNDFCTLGKTQLISNETTQDGLIRIFQYTGYPRFQLSINERLHHYNLSIVHVSNKDEGIFQCQVQRTMNAHEARSERVHLILIAPPNGQPTLLLPHMPLKQGQSVNITCLSAPSKPASKLMLYKNEQIIAKKTSLMHFYEFDMKTKKNLTKLVYNIDDLDGDWDNARVRCEQIYQYADNFQKDVSTRIQVQYKPKARIESQNRHSLSINSTATFRCIVHGNPEPQLRWFANAMDLTSITSSVINIPLSRHVHNHSIGCTATNSIGTTNTSLRLIIRYPPTFVIRPPKFVVVDFDNKSPSSKPMILRCVVDSFPRSAISWFRYGHKIAEGSTFNLENITTREQQGLYSYRIETSGFETIHADFIIYIKGKPLIYIQESRQYRSSNNREFECQVYSSTSILRISWKLNGQSIESNDQSLISTICDENSCLSKLTYNNRKIVSSTNNINRLSCIAENEYGYEQSRLYQIDFFEDQSTTLISIILSIFILLIILSIAAIYCGCRVRRSRKSSMKNLPIVYDAHYSINELIKDVTSLQASDGRLRKTTFNDNDRLSLTLEQNKIEPTDNLMTSLFNNNRTKKLMDNLSNESSTNSSGFHSKSTTTTFNNNNEYSPRFAEITDYTFSGITPLYTSQYQMNV